MNIPTIPAKTILSKQECGWFGSNYNMNLYRGCSHGCIYCDSRSNCYQVHDFDTVKVKSNALLLVQNELRSKRHKGMIITGSMSDVYNPAERALKLTRDILQLIDTYGFGIGISTKSNLVLRDIDLLEAIRKHSPAIVSFTITTAEDELCRRIEPNVCASSERFDAIKELSAHGIPCGIFLMPILPFINDTWENIVGIVQKAYESGAKWIYAAGGNFSVTLRENQREYFYKKLDEVFPGVKQKYIRQYGYSYECISPNNTMLLHAFNEECKKLGILNAMDEITSLVQYDYQKKQLRLF